MKRYDEIVIHSRTPKIGNDILTDRRHILILLLSLLFPSLTIGDIPSISGGGNFTNGSTSTVKLRALQTIGARALRLNLYPHHYWNRSARDSRAERLDEQMELLHQHGLNPIVLLFEYYGHYSEANDAPRDSATWFLIGRGFANRWRPNSEYLVGRGILDWGIQVFQAINEPDVQSSLPLDDYTTMLKGLAAGVHSVDATLKVIPGGFMRENASSDHTLGGYGTAIAPLLNAGILDGIDLHTYNDTRYAPIEKTETGQWFWSFSPQSDFDEVKRGSGIIRDINFYATEYGFKNQTQGITPEYCAKRTLTCIWANLAVTKQDGRTTATKFALIWQLFSLDTTDHTYGLASKIDPVWEGNPAGKTFQMVMNLTEGMEFVSINEPVKGVFVLQGNGRKMWVWQNLPKWTETPGSSFTLTGIPADADSILVYRWDSWTAPFRQVGLSRQNEITINGLLPNETYMFIADCSESTHTSQRNLVVSHSSSSRYKSKCLVVGQSLGLQRSHTLFVYDLRGRSLTVREILQSGGTGVWLQSTTATESTR